MRRASQAIATTLIPSPSADSPQPGISRLSAGWLTAGQYGTPGTSAPGAGPQHRQSQQHGPRFIPLEVKRAAGAVGSRREERPRWPVYRGHHWPSMTIAFAQARPTIR
jgi:hypothetical protein